MSLHVVVAAGPVGSAIACLLAGRGDPARPHSAKGRVRAGLWAAQLAAHTAGRVRTAEVRGSDYLGAGAQTFFTIMVLPAVLKERRALAPADLDAPHSWTYTDDMARTM